MGRPPTYAAPDELFLFRAGDVQLVGGSVPAGRELGAARRRGEDFGPGDARNCCGDRPSLLAAPSTRCRNAPPVATRRSDNRGCRRICGPLCVRVGGTIPLVRRRHTSRRTSGGNCHIFIHRSLPPPTLPSGAMLARGISGCGGCCGGCRGGRRVAEGMPRLLPGLRVSTAGVPDADGNGVHHRADVARVSRPCELPRPCRKDGSPARH